MAKHPSYRIAALATLDLDDHMEKSPVEITEPGDIKWKVTREGSYYVARGMIEIPVEMYFLDSPESNDPVIERVVVNGKRKYDARDVPEEEEPDYGIDKDVVQAQSFVRYKSNLEH